MKIIRNVITPLLFTAVASLLANTLLQCEEKYESEQIEDSTHHHHRNHNHDKELLPRNRCEISIYDNVFRRVAKSIDIDWRLMSAIAYRESRFRSDVVSKRGAIGIMQIMPHVAREYGISEEELFDPITNIELAAHIIKSIEKMIHLPATISQTDRTAFLLACYNGGYAHVSDARNLANYYGDDDLSWSVVSEYLELLADTDFYEHEAVSYGEFKGFDETLKFVNAVMSRYDKYCHIATPDEA